MSPSATRLTPFRALRRFILDLAVRGKLVEQNPNDRSVAVSLLKTTTREG